MKMQNSLQVLRQKFQPEGMWKLEGISSLRGDYSEIFEPNGFFPLLIKMLQYFQ